MHHAAVFDGLGDVWIKAKAETTSKLRPPFPKPQLIPHGPPAKASRPLATSSSTIQLNVPVSYPATQDQWLSSQAPRPPSGPSTPSPSFVTMWCTCPLITQPGSQTVLLRQQLVATNQKACMEPVYLADQLSLHLLHARSCLNPPAPASTAYINTPMYSVSPASACGRQWGVTCR